MQSMRFAEPLEQEVKMIVGYSRVLGVSIDSVMEMSALRFDVGVGELSELLHQEQLNQYNHNLQTSFKNGF
jgi:hypothetical protein